MAILENINAFTDKSWYWKSVGILSAYSILFNVLYTFSLKYLNRKLSIVLNFKKAYMGITIFNFIVTALSKPNQVVSEEPELEVEDQRYLSVDNGNMCKHEVMNSHFLITFLQILFSFL